jgi:hypothetical protein
MTDTAELIAHANHEVDLHEANRSYMPGDMWELIADMVIALTAQAQEIERCKSDFVTQSSLIRAFQVRAEGAEAHVRELEDTTMSVECLDAVRRDVEAATIERCAKLADGESLLSIGVSPSMERIEIATAIRALAKEPLTPPPL